MSIPQEVRWYRFPNFEVRIGDSLVKMINERELIFKGHRSERFHYSVFVTDSLLGFHKTMEGEYPRHVSEVKKEFDLQSYLKMVSLEIWAEWERLFQIVKVDLILT